MLDLLLLGFAIILWACYCCRKRHGIEGLRRVPIIGSEPTAKMTEEERLALIEKQLVTVTIGGSVQSLRNLITSAQSMYEANSCNCGSSGGGGSSANSGNAEDEKDCENFDESASERSCLSRTLSAAYTTIAQHRQEECIICFEEYKEGDEICWAKTDQCQHVFHKKCAVQWLKQHDECPLCRIDIIHAKTVTYEQADYEMEATDLELGGDEGQHEETTNENGNDGTDADIEASTETSEVPQRQEEPTNSSMEGENDSQTKAEGDLEEDLDAEMATSSKGGDSPKNGSDCSSEDPESPVERKQIPSKLVDFSGSIHTINGDY